MATAAPEYAFEPLTLTTADGTRLAGGLLRRTGADRTVNCYGGSGTGAISAEPLLDDGLLVFDHGAGLPCLDPSRLVVHGHSMGRLVAGQLAANRATAGVVLESSMTTTEDFVGTQVPWYGRPFVRMDIAPGLRRKGNLRQMGRIEEPLLLLVGSRDTDTPPRFSRSLYDASSLPPSRKQLMVIEGAMHSDVPERPVAISAYRAFLQLTSG